MKVPIAPRLFAGVLLALLGVAVIALPLVRWQVLHGAHGAADPAEAVEREALRLLGDDLATAFGRHHDWSFLPAGAGERQRWLRARLLDLPTPGASARDERRLAPNLGDRLGLLDRDDALLVGVRASRVVVAVASIDTIRWPVQVDGRTVGFLLLARPDDPADELAVAFLVQQQGRLLALAAVALVLGALAAALLAMHFRRPIARLAAGARRLQSGDFDARVGLRRSDELGELATTMDHLALRLADGERARRQWVADTSHELRTPLSVLRAQLEAMQDGIRAATPDQLALLLRQVASLGRRVDELDVLARADAGQLHFDRMPLDAWSLVVEAVAAFAEKFRAREVVATLGPVPARTAVRGDAERLRQLLANLLENAVRYTAPGGRIDVHGEVVGDALQVTIDDTAPGVAADALARLGERFFRGDGAREAASGGAGLGLALCRHIVGAHGGALDFSASPLGGLRVRVSLPLEAAA